MKVQSCLARHILHQAVVLENMECHHHSLHHQNGINSLKHLNGNPTKENFEKHRKFP
jgi:hypothetical protein